MCAFPYLVVQASVCSDVLSTLLCLPEDPTSLLEQDSWNVEQILKYAFEW